MLSEDEISDSDMSSEDDARAVLSEDDASAVLPEDDAADLFRAMEINLIQNRPCCVECDAYLDVDLVGRPYGKVYRGTWSDLCHLCRRQAQTLVWATRPNWGGLLRVNLRYIGGHIDASPLACEPVPLRLESLVPSLTVLHEYGLLCTGAGIVATYDKQLPKFVDGQPWYRVPEKPFYRFLIPTTHKGIGIAQVKKLVDALFQHPDVFTTVWSDCDDYPYPETLVNGIRETVPLYDIDESGEELDKIYYFRSNAPYYLRSNTPYHSHPKSPARRIYKEDDGLGRTRTSFDLFPAGLNTMYTGASEIPLGASTCGMLVYGERFPVIRKMRPLSVQILAREILAEELTTETNLQTLVETTCKEVGMKKVFQKVSNNYVKATRDLYKKHWIQVRARLFRRLTRSGVSKQLVRRITAPVNESELAN